MIVLNGELLAYLNRNANHLTTFGESEFNDELADTLARFASPEKSACIEKVNGQFAADSSLAAALLNAGFKVTTTGLLHKGLREV